MRMERFTYQEAESALYEAMRWRGTNGKIIAERESRSRIDESMTCYNVYYVKECLLPDGKFRTKKYAKEHRGEAIAEYHNSQVSSQSRAMMSGKRASNAIGVVATLPRDNPWLKRCELTDEEYAYLRDKMIEKPHDATSHTRNEALEKSIRDKLTRVRPTEEEMEQINAFLHAVIDAWLEVCQIRREDVLFYAIHWDESFPHAHALALPTVERTYEEDVYSKKVKKDGFRTLLHKAGETAITYSVSRFYAEPYYGNDGKRHYPFMDTYHQKTIECMQNNLELSDEIRQTASKLLNGATKRHGLFSPRDYNREQRDESVFLAEANRVLQAKNAEMQEEFDRKKAFLQARLDEAQAKALAAKKETAAAQAEALAAKSDVKVAEEMVEALQAQEIHLRREISSLSAKFREIVSNLKDVAKKVVEDALARFVPLLRKVKNQAEEEAVEMKAKASISGEILRPIAELEAEASALLDESPTRDINLSRFSVTPQRYGYAVAQIKKAAQGTRYDAEFLSVTKENAEDNPIMKLCLEDWFNREKYAAILPSMTEEEEVEYMKSPVRAARAIEYLDACVQAGLVEFDDYERG